MRRYTLNHKQPMATPQLSTSAEDSEGERLLLSLNRLGTPKARSTRPHQLTQPVRRRFVRDGEVPTEYAGRHELPAPPSESDEALASLRAELAAEQAAREEAEQALSAAKTSNRTLQTRVGHMELELEEMRGRAQRAAAEAAEAADAVRRLEARPTRIAKATIVADDGDEEDEADGPQPVKWWLKK